jgi:hypothetical protein
MDPDAPRAGLEEPIPFGALPRVEDDPLDVRRDA